MVKGENLPTLKSMLNSFDRHNVSAKEVKSTISVYINLEPQPAKNDVIQNFQECLPVETIFQHDIIGGQTDLFNLTS